MKSYLLLILIICTISCSRLPQSSCITLEKKFQGYPISVNQTLTFNLDNLFFGLNLTFLTQYSCTLGQRKQKIDKTVDKKIKNQGLQKYHLSHQKKSWSNSLITLSVVGNDTIIRWGSATKDENFPNLPNEAILTNDSTITCFDAFWFQSQMIIIVDCLQNKNKKLQNVFFYLDSKSKTVVQKLNNNLYVPFKTIQDRKIEVINKNGQNYLIRGYLSNKVNKQSEDKVYIEVISINNPLKPYTIGIIDRTIIRASSFKIMDFTVYFDSIFILDYYSGVIKIDIQPNNDITLSQKYQTNQGFNKFGVYFDSLDYSYYLALANQQTILQIKWQNSYKHEVISKYSIPNNSQVHSLWLNQQYIVIHFTSNLTDSVYGQTSSYHSTYVFTKQSVSYLNAYFVIKHQDTQTFVDFSQEDSSILTMDSNEIVIYKINHPILMITPANTQKKQCNIIAKSLFYQENSFFCIMNIQFRIYQTYNPQFIWPLSNNPTTYYVNRKGDAQIQIDRYALAPNLTYKVTHNSKVTPQMEIYHQNPLKITWRQKIVNKFKYLIFLSKQYNRQDSQFYLFLQNDDNLTEFNRCYSSSQDQTQIICDVRYMYHMNFKISAIAANTFEHIGKNYHFVAVNYKALDQNLFIYDVQDGNIALFPFMFPRTVERTISSFQFIGKYFAVVFQYSKEVYIYDMGKCLDFRDNDCKQSFVIDRKVMLGLGIDYFGPVKAHSSDFHSNILFLECIDRILVLGINKQAPVFLAQLKLGQEFKLNKRQVIIGKSRIVLINPPNIIKQYDLQEISDTKTLAFLKNYPTYNYILTDNFNSTFSDISNLFYITAIDPSLPNKQNNIILIYKSDVPAMLSLYHTYPLQQDWKDVRIGVIGKMADNVILVYGSNIVGFRQYQNPILKIRDLTNDQFLTLSYTNDPLQLKWYNNTIQLKRTNVEQKITVKDSRLNDDDFITNQINYRKRQNSIDDFGWFTGSVVNYTLLNCQECSKKIKLINHIQQEEIIADKSFGKIKDYAFTPEGGIIQQQKQIVLLNADSSIRQIVTLTRAPVQCFIIEESEIYKYSLSVCQSSNEISLYKVSYMSKKPTITGPFATRAKYVTSLDIAQDIVMIVDVDKQSSSLVRIGGVILYALLTNPQGQQILEELQYIDTKLLSRASNWSGGPCYIGNAQLTYTNTSIYRLYITQKNNGLFILDFKWSKGNRNIQILVLSFAFLKENLNKISYPLPESAYFTAVAQLTSEYYREFRYWQIELVVTTNTFHSFHVYIYIDRALALAFCEINRIYHKYGQYYNDNSIQVHNGFIAIRQIVPGNNDVFGVVVYNSKGYVSNNQVRYILGGYFNIAKGRNIFKWDSSTTGESNSKMFAMSSEVSQIRVLSVNKQLTIITEDKIAKNQQVTLKARNEYNYFDLYFKIKVESQKGPKNKMLQTQSIVKEDDFQKRISLI